MSTISRAAEVTLIDPVWDAVTSGGRTVAQAEPSLANLVYSNVLNHESFESALAHRLAERLGHPDVSADLIRQAFHDALEIRPEIGLEARADLAATLERDPALHKAVDGFLYFKGNAGLILRVSKQSSHFYFLRYFQIPISPLARHWWMRESPTFASVTLSSPVARSES